MLEVFLTRNSRKGVWLKLPSTQEEQGEAFAALDVIESWNQETQISDAISSVGNLSDYIRGAVLTSQTLAELSFLSIRLEGLSEIETALFSGALAIERPHALKDIINLSCNLDKFSFYEGINTEDKLGKYLLDLAGDEIPEYLTVLLDYEYVGRKYAQKHPSCFCKEGYVLKLEEALTTRYDGQSLPDSYNEKDSPIILDIHLNGKYVSLYLPEPESKLEGIEKRLESFRIDERASFSSKENVKGLYSRLPCGASVRELNYLAGTLKQVLDGTEGNREKVLAVLEAEAPATVEEAVQVLGRLRQYNILLDLEDFTEPSDYVYKVMEENPLYYLDSFTADFVDFEALCKAMMKEEGAVLTSFGIVVREGHRIHSLPEERSKFRLFSSLTGKICRDGGPEVVSANELLSSVGEIRRAVEQERPEDGEGRGLAVYLKHEILKRKVFCMIPAVAVWNHELWGVLEVETYGTLSEGEVEELKSSWSAQCADGWGEYFKQCPIPTRNGELYVSFWQPGNDFCIKLESELKEQPEQLTGLQMQ